MFSNKAITSCISTSIDWLYLLVNRKSGPGDLKSFPIHLQSQFPSETFKRVDKTIYIA